MAPPSFRLDNVCLKLIERLEGARRTWRGDPAGAEEGLRRIGEETMDRLVAEYREVMGPGPYADALRHEALETFLPRYIRLAVDFNAIEEQGYLTWRQGDPVARVVAGGVALLAAMALQRIIHHPLAVIGFALALLVPFVPEIKGWFYRRQYGRLLGEVIEDMTRIQPDLDERALLVEDEHTPSAAHRQKPPTKQST